MLQKLTFVSPRDNDTLTIRRGQALALVIILFMVVEVGLSAISIVDRDSSAELDSLLGWVVFIIVYVINRTGRVRLATNILMFTGTFITILGAIIADRPIPTLFFLGLIVVVAAAFGRPRTPILWALGLSFVPLVINLGVYGSPYAPSAPILQPDGRLMPSIATQELHSLGLLWMLAGTAYLSSQLLNQMLDESRAATRQAIASNQKLRRSEERFAKIFRASPVGIGITSVVSGRFVEVNDTFLQILGYRNEEVIGRTAGELRMWERPDEADRIEEIFRTQRSPHNLEKRLRTKTSELRDVLISLELIELGDELCLLTMVHDITERKQTEQALRESEERYRLITENTNDLIALFDADWRYVYISPSHHQVLGYASNQLLGTSAAGLVHPDDQPALLAQWAQLAPQDNMETTFRFRHADGSWHWLEASGTHLAWQGQIYNLTVARDVTERKNLEQQLLQAQKMESIGRLAGGVAHDFNNLLTAITGYADLVIDELPRDTPARADLEDLRKAADRATNLTRQLLAFARRQKIELRVVDLNQIIRDMCSLIHRLIGEQIELVTRLADDLRYIRADTSQIEQVIVNLVINAHDAMPRGGKLIIETANVSFDPVSVHNYADIPVGEYVMLAISDTGVGMDATIQQHLFEPFFTTKEPGRGTGLGLATCYGIVRQHGGFILPYSESGRGTIMRVYLPQLTAALDPPLAPAGEYEYPRGSEKILLVEDEAAVRALAVRVLRNQGYTVTEASNGVEALRIVAEHPDAQFELLLTDMMMPQMGGHALAERMTELYPGLRILFTSGYTEDGMIHDAGADSGVHFLHKPFSPASLAQKVRRVLDLP